MRYEIVLAPEAAQDLKRLPAHKRAAVKDGLELHLRHEPEKTSRSRTKRLRGVERPQYGLRIDDVRVFFDVGEYRVEVLAIVEKVNASSWLKREGEKK